MKIIAPSKNAFQNIGTHQNCYTLYSKIHDYSMYTQTIVKNYYKKLIKKIL